MILWKATGFNFIAVFVVFVELFISTRCSYQGEEVTRWADTIGDILWDLGKRITKYSEIDKRYIYLNAKVEPKDPERLLAEIVKNISRMMDRKMDAIQCIVEMAENKSMEFVYENTTEFLYYSSKFSAIEGMPHPKYKIKVINESLHRYLPMKLNNDTHFYNLPVNTSHSSVHVPTNIFDLHEAPATAIQWSEALDQVFVQNYKSDPSLSWQYFGSLSGIFRHYPAKQWVDIKKDRFDCRIRTWFIEASTCTKDLVILMDTSGSMEAMGKHIGVFTAQNILDTLSNNDYVNILNYTKRTNYTIPCFENLLVQATEENINVFKYALNHLNTTNKTDIDQALRVAFELLAHYRTDIRHCDGVTSFCNQAIMIISDGISRNISDIVMEYDFLNNGSYIPVRIFSYLVGQEVTNEEEIKWVSCATKGYYMHVQSLEQVTSAVLQYINVIARPLILQEVDHPVSWTHAYMDDTYDDSNDIEINEPYRLLTSAAAPAFDKKANMKSRTKTVNLLGVAATDVPIDDIQKLTLPYRIGAIGYAFIVSNNGYILMHPYLTPMVGDSKTINYNSIDISEVEQIVTASSTPRELASKVLELRSYLINGTSGKLMKVPIKYHYDSMKRVSIEYFDYYYAPLTNTPFTMAIAIPHSCGQYILKVGNEIEKNKHTGINLTNFFEGHNWKVHPKWSYCGYHYLEGHEFKSVEDRIYHFLGRMYFPDFIWKRQYEVKKENQNISEDEDLDQIDCGRKTLGPDDYYCNYQLVQRLVFDAKNTKDSFDKPWDFLEQEKKVFEQFDVNLRFVATMSGLTRWEYKNESDVKEKKRFGDLHNKAIDEVWYKAAVLQHQYNRESFVYMISEQESTITGSYAIFPKDDGHEAPGCVVGFQFSQEKLRQRVVDITTRPSIGCPECGTCDTSLVCYIVDNSGYIILSVSSETDNNTGKFFGEVAGDIMQSMEENGIFEKIIVYDYQGLCQIDDSLSSTGNILKNPINLVYTILNWFGWQLLHFSLRFNVYNFWMPIYTIAQNDTMGGDSDDEEDDQTDLDLEEVEGFPCDKQAQLYVLQQHFLNSNNFSGEFTTPNNRDYYIKQIPFSNLIFVAASNIFPASSIKISATPTLIEYEEDFPCYKINLNNLPRGTLKGCYFKNEKENKIMECGKSHIMRTSYFLFSFVLLLNIICRYIY